MLVQESESRHGFKFSRSCSSWFLSSPRARDVGAGRFGFSKDQSWMLRDSITDRKGKEEGAQALD